MSKPKYFSIYHQTPSPTGSSQIIPNMGLLVAVKESASGERDIAEHAWASACDIVNTQPSFL